MTRHRMRERRKKRYAEREARRRLTWIVQRGGRLYLSPDAVRLVESTSTPAGRAFRNIPFSSNPYIPPGLEDFGERELLIMDHLEP